MSGTLILLIIYAPSLVGAVLFTGVAALALWEFFQLLDAGTIHHDKRTGTWCGILLVALAGLMGGHPAAAEAIGMLLFCFVGVLVIRRFLDPGLDRPVMRIGSTLLGIVYVGFAMTFLARIYLGWPGDPGRLLFFYFILVVKITDTGAYFTGRALGRHKFFPRVSPAKTWEGVAGGVLTALTLSLLVRWIAGPDFGVVTMSWIDAVVLGLLLSSAGILGDLAESLIKRTVGVKDSGTLIQGMGGVLDVLDSLLFAAPVMYSYARLFMEHSV